MKKVVLTFGLISGVIMVLMMAITMLLQKEQTDFRLAEVIGYSSMIVSLSMVFFGIRSYRNNNLQGRISFGKAFQVGLYITLIGSSLYVAGWMLYSNLSGPELMNQYYEQNLANVRNSGAPQAEIEAKIKQMESFRELYKNPMVQIGITFLEIFPVGLFITLICAFILKRPTKTPELTPA